jgi:hypothetical protein
VIFGLVRMKVNAARSKIATVTGLKPGQKVKVTVNVKGKK